MSGVSYMDISSAQELMELIERLKKEGVQLSFSGVTESVNTMMERSGINVLLA